MSVRTCDHLKEDGAYRESPAALRYSFGHLPQRFREKIGPATPCGSGLCL